MGTCASTGSSSYRVWYDSIMGFAFLPSLSKRICVFLVVIIVRCSISIGVLCTIHLSRYCPTHEKAGDKTGQNKLMQYPQTGHKESFRIGRPLRALVYTGKPGRSIELTVGARCRHHSLIHY